MPRIGICWLWLVLLGLGVVFSALAKVMAPIDRAPTPAPIPTAVHSFLFIVLLLRACVITRCARGSRADLQDGKSRV